MRLNERGPSTIDLIGMAQNTVNETQATWFESPSRMRMVQGVALQELLCYQEKDFLGSSFKIEQQWSNLSGVSQVKSNSQGVAPPSSKSGSFRLVIVKGVTLWTTWLLDKSEKTRDNLWKTPYQLILIDPCQLMSLKQDQSSYCVTAGTNSR